ncbi:MAG: S9 family peptidase, partial [Bacteroidetes bacterium]|nr:S9 family peptidase [Bacteroidota bacterium]
MTYLKTVTWLSVLISIIQPSVLAQSNSSQPLSVESIMRDPGWMGHFPDQIRWAENSKHVYFNWNPENNPDDSLYAVSVIPGEKPQKVSPEARRAMPASGNWNQARTQKVYEKYGDLFLYSFPGGKVQQITNTLERESNPIFSLSESS